ncbi:MAG: hypothetical protein ACXVB9_20915 [Bdellovibrionota bacterium]
MDRISDNWKKYPLLVIGEFPAMPAGAELLALSDAASHNLNDFYFVVAQNHAVAVAELLRAKVRPEQIVVYLRADSFFDHPSQLCFGWLDQLEAESGDELRARLLNKLEGQRQKKLLSAFGEANESEITRRLPEAELNRRLDITRIAHSLCCGYGLGPAAHWRILHACLNTGMPEGETWAGDPPVECLIWEAAVFLHDTLAGGKAVREAIRERSTALNYRTRTEFLHQVENCLSALTGARHVA